MSSDDYAHEEHNARVAGEFMGLGLEPVEQSRSAPESRVVEQGSDDFVASLPRRQAHALYALFAASRELRMPPTAAEMVYYDAEAFSARGTAAALREAAQKGLCICAGGNWFALGDALLIGERAFERRFLADTDEQP